MVPGDIENVARKLGSHVMAMAEALPAAIKEVVQEHANAQMRPSVLYRPKLSCYEDGWCALYGEDMHTGVYGIGMTPADAMLSFDAAWQERCTSGQAEAQEATPVAPRPVIDIRIEGVRGAGKSTLARVIREALATYHGIQSIVYDENPHSLRHLDARIAKLKKKHVEIRIHTHTPAQEPYQYKNGDKQPGTMP